MTWTKKEILICYCIKHILKAEQAMSQAELKQPKKNCADLF